MAAIDLCQVRCVDMSRVDRVRSQMPEAPGPVALFKALADPTRLQVVCALLYEELCVCEIAALLDTSVQTASHHLRWLKRAGLATYRKEGKLVYYRLVPDAMGIVRRLVSWQAGPAADDSAVTG